MTNGSLMKVESIAECSLGLKTNFGLFLSGCLRQVLLYIGIVVRKPDFVASK